MNSTSTRSFMGYLITVSDDKLTTGGSDYKTLKIRVNTGFDFRIITTNAFQTNKNHSLTDTPLNSKVALEVVEKGNFFNLRKIQPSDFEDCFRCEAPIIGIQLGQGFCAGCYSDPREKVAFNGTVSSKEERDYTFGRGTVFKIDTTTGSYFSVFYHRSCFEGLVSKINIGDVVEGSGWVLENNLLKVSNLEKI